MVLTFTANARRLGIASALLTVLLMAMYMVTLAAGLFSLASPDQPIGDPYFTVLEVLILLMMPLMIGLMAAVHARAPDETQIFSLIALIFMVLVAGLTCSVHFVILTVSRQAAFVGLSWTPLFFSFRWPSVVYALDILAWDVFFAFSVLFAAPIFRGDRLATGIRMLLVASGLLSFAGLLGVITGDMGLRNIGIIGYTVVFPVAALLLAILFRRERPREA